MDMIKRASGGERVREPLQLRPLGTRVSAAVCIELSPSEVPAGLRTWDQLAPVGQPAEELLELSRMPGQGMVRRAADVGGAGRRGAMYIAILHAPGETTRLLIAALTDDGGTDG